MSASLFAQETDASPWFYLQDSADSDVRHIRVGICAMSKKSHSKPMLEILERLILFENIKPVIFDEDVILNEPIENWPVCDCLISFHSSGFPLNKAVKYAELRKPMVINDLYMQYKIQDRCVVSSLITISIVWQCQKL